MITYNYKVNMTPGGIPPRCKLGQYDDDWSIVFSLYTDYGTFNIESGTTAKIRGTKRDGLGYSANATINISAGTVTVAGDKQITAISGDNVFELVLLKGTKELSTANIIFAVEPAAMDVGTLVSDSQVQEILDMSADVIAASENVSTLRGNFAPAYSSSDTYAVGDYAMYNNQLYRCTIAITTAEAWTAGHWTAVALGGDVSNLKSDVLYNSDALGTTDYVHNLGVTVGQLKNDGTVNQSQTGWVTTGYIPLVQGSKYFLQRLSSTTDYTVYRCTYSQDKTLINYVSFTSQSPIREYYIPSGVYYVRFSVSVSVYDSGFSFRKAENRLDKDGKYLTYIGGAVESADCLEGGIDYLNGRDVFFGRINSSGGLDNLESFRSTDFIPVIAGKSYKLYNSTGDTFSVWVSTFDSQKELLTYKDNAEATNGVYRITAPNSAAYIRFGYSLAAHNTGLQFRTITNWVTGIKTDLLNVENVVGTTDYISRLGVFVGKLGEDGTVSDNSAMVSSDYIPVTPGLTYALERPGQTSGYTLVRCEYDSNKVLIGRVEFTSTSPIRIYTAVYGASFVRFSFSTGVYDGGIRFRLLNNYIDKPKYISTQNKDVFSYVGDEIDVKAHKKYVCEKMYDTPYYVVPSGKTAQAFAIYNNAIFQFLAEDACRLYDYSTGKILNDIELKCGHANSAVFSTEFFSNNDEFPLLYVSDTNGNVYVSRVTRTGATLIRTLYFAPEIFGYYPQLSINTDTTNCYIVGSQTEDVVAANPSYIISTCNLSNIELSGEKYIVPASSSFNVQINGENIVLQGTKYLNGYIWVTSGGTSTSVLSRITIIDIAEEAVASTIINFPENVSIHELEDVEFIKNNTTSNFDVILHVREYGYYRLVF